ncbi:hypothetical protein AAFF_G00248900 [Aldrovandia affinis]|uniref:Uncharacterized protein n=1 Tax=Aldrovandia affinis TaxID=143900 RepID=A0AAD7W2R6_9TELE|nr:hypothetical protein AAFF_G00248900 [Aldrovandia affinis]
MAAVAVDSLSASGGGVSWARSPGPPSEGQATAVAMFPSITLRNERSPDRISLDVRLGRRNLREWLFEP